ncbi:MAG: peptidoglycan-binding protein LysM [Bacteroidota bacterium]
MGLFSFLKNAGSNILNKVTGKTAAAPEVEKVELSKSDALKAEIAKLGLPVENLDISFGEQIIVGGKTEDNATREKVILALGNTEGVTSVDDRIEVANPEPEANFYTVQKGDSLSKIAKAQYGDAMKYNAIFEANKPMLSHPDKIYPGQVLRIPAL